METADYLKERLGGVPEMLIIAGSGLSGLGELAEDAVEVPYSEIPGFLRSTVKSHRGVLVGGRIRGKRVAIMCGRFHYYEGYDLKKLVYPVEAFARLGTKTLIVTNAAGGIDQSFQPGDLMLIRDHINFAGLNPMLGPNDDTLGERFFDMTYAYDPELQAVCREAALACGVPLREGVYLWTLGPSFETPAEIRFFRQIGASAVGMSTVPEVIAARHAGMRVLGVSCITNLAAGILPQPLSHQEVMAVGDQVKERLSNLMAEVISRI